MSSVIHVINKINTTELTIYETECGDVIFSGKIETITPFYLFDLISSLIGVYDHAEYHELTSDQYDNWQDNI